MAPTFVNFSAQTLTATDTLTPAIPSGTQEGDLLILFVSTAASSVATPPAGWTQHLSQQRGTGTSLLVAWSKIAGPSEPAPTIVMTSANPHYGQLHAWRSASGVDVVSSSTQTSVVNSVTMTPTVTTSAADETVLYATGFAAASNWTINWTNATERTDHTGAISGGFHGLSTASITQASAGTTPSNISAAINGGGTVSNWVWCTIAIEGGPVLKNGTDTGTLSDTATVKVQPTVETGVFTDTATVLVQASDAAVLTEAASAGEMIVASDVGTFTDTASVSVATDNFVSDSIEITDNAFVSIGAVGSDVAEFTDDASVIVHAADSAVFYDATQLLDDGHLVAARVKVIPADNRVVRVTAEERNVEVEMWDSDE